MFAWSESNGCWSYACDGARPSECEGGSRVRAFFFSLGDGADELLICKIKADELFTCAGFTTVSKVPFVAWVGKVELITSFLLGR
jgi:hypothetical protein